jgi:hypothetical protein
MKRNLDRRVESYFPVLDPGLQQWIQKWVLDLQLADTQKRRVLLPDGSWARVDSGAGPSPSKETVGNSNSGDAVLVSVQPSVNAQETCIQGLVKKKEDFVNKPVDTDAPNATLKKLVKAATKRLV